MNTCCFCNHRGEDVNKRIHIHIGGKGEMEYMACDSTEACVTRVTANEKKLENCPLGIPICDGCKHFIHTEWGNPYCSYDARVEKEIEELKSYWG